MSLITIEDGIGIGRSGQEQTTNATAIQQRLMSLIGELENSRTSWDGNSGVAFINAKNRLLEQFGLLNRSQGEIGAGLGESQRHVNTGEDLSTTEVHGAEGAISGVNAITRINV